MRRHWTAPVHLNLPGPPTARQNASLGQCELSNRLRQLHVLRVGVDIGGQSRAAIHHEGRVFAPNPQTLRHTSGVTRKFESKSKTSKLLLHSTFAWCSAVALTVICCLYCEEASAQLKLVDVQREEDVIANSIVQPGLGTNNAVIRGPLVPVGSIKFPIIYTIRTELDGDKTTTVLAVTFDSPNGYQIFQTVVNEEGRKILVNPPLQQEIQGRKEAEYIVGLSQQYLEKACKSGIKWSFQGTTSKAAIKVPAFFFAGFLKKVATAQAALRPSPSDKSLVFSGSIGKPEGRSDKAKNGMRS